MFNLLFSSHSQRHIDCLYSKILVYILMIFLRQVFSISLLKGEEVKVIKVMILR